MNLIGMDAMNFYRKIFKFNANVELYKLLPCNCKVKPEDTWFQNITVILYQNITHRLQIHNCPSVK